MRHLLRTAILCLLLPSIAGAQTALQGDVPQGGTAFLKSTTASATTMGSELTTNGGFVGSGANWTASASWAYGSNNAIWTVGTADAGTLSQSITVTAGVSYLVQWDQTNSARSNGTITPSIGTASGLPLGFQTTGPFIGNQQIIVAAATGSVLLKFVGGSIGTPTGSITITNISVKAITPSAPAVRLQNSNGTVDTQFSPGGAGLGNNFFGLDAGKFALGSGYQNTAGGASVLVNLTSGYGNTGGGFGALHSNTTGNNNTAFGRQALYNNLAGVENVAMGLSAMINNISGSENTAIGTSALENNLTGWSNQAISNGALTNNTTGTENTCVGENCLFNSNGDNNSALGFGSGQTLTTGNSNILLGYYAGGYNLTTGSGNILLGNGADVPTGATNGLLNIGNVLTVTNMGTPATSIATLTASSFNLAGGPSTNVGLTVTADQTSGASAVLNLAPRVGSGTGVIQTSTNAPLILGTNGVPGATLDTSHNLSVIGNISAGATAVLAHVANNAAMTSATTFAYPGGAVARDGFASPGDGGRATYNYSASACSISGGDGGSQIPSNSGGCWLIDKATPITIELFGADPTGATYSDVAIQNTVNYVVGHVGGRVGVPTGMFTLSPTAQIAVNGPVQFWGEGPGLYYSTYVGGSLIRTSNPTGTAFVVQSRAAVRFRDFAIDSSVTQTAGGAISIAGDNSSAPSYDSSYNFGSVIEGMTFGDGLWNAVTIHAAQNYSIAHNMFKSWVNNGVFLQGDGAGGSNPDATVGQSHIIGNSFHAFDTYYTANAAVQYQCGGDMEIVGNKMIGGHYGVQLSMKYGPTGTLLITANSMEQHVYSEISVSRVDLAASFNTLSVVGNQFSTDDVPGGTFTTNYQGSINLIDDGRGGDWLLNVNITGNTFNHVLPASVALVNIQTGYGVTVAHNILSNLNQPNLWAFGAGGAAKQVLFDDNNVRDMPGGTYNTVTNVALIRDATRTVTAASPLATQRNLVAKRTVDLASLNASAWTTVWTLTPANIPTGSYGYALVDASMTGHTNVTSQGIRKTSWQITVYNGALSVAQIGTDVIVDTPIQFRLFVSGGNILVQVQSSNGTNVIDGGTLDVTAQLPSISGANVSWSY